MKKQQVNASTGEVEEVDLTPEEIAEYEALVDEVRNEALEIERLSLVAKNEAILQKTLLQTFVGYLELHLQGNLPVVTFADFMGEVFSRYMQNGGTITP